MKKVLVFCVAALAVLAVSCQKKSQGSDIDWSKVTVDGFYVAGPATGSDEIKPDCVMAAGFNEADKAARDGMYEKYIVLEANKDFYLLYNDGGKKERYSADLKEFETPLEEAYNDNPEKVLKGKLVIGESAPAMKVAKTGLYHIVLDMNKIGDLKEAQILLLDASAFQMIGAFGTAESDPAPATFSNDGVTFTYKGVEIIKNQWFKFRTGNYWKVTLDDAGKVKAEVSLGAGMSQNGGDIKLETSGKYDVTLVFKLAAGGFDKSFTFTPTLKEEIVVNAPEHVYMTGSDFGGWSWGSDGIAEFQHVSAGGDPKDDAFVITRYFKKDNGVKFSSINVKDDWSKAFAGMSTNPANATYDGDGNLHVPADGLWTITLDYGKDEMTLTEGMIYGMGPAFNNDWTAGKFPGVVNADGTATITALSEGDLRVYAPCAFDWWQHEFKPTNDGKIEYREAGELAEFKVAAGKKITFNFNAGTTVIE